MDRFIKKVNKLKTYLNEVGKAEENEQTFHNYILFTT
jgi:hypothetical protein